MTDPDFDRMLRELGVGKFHHPAVWIHNYGFYPNYVRKAQRIGAILEEPRGPRGGRWWAIASEERWGRMKQWRAALSLGARMVRDKDLR